MEEKSYIKVCRESFATDEDWECVCEEVGADTETTDSVIIYWPIEYLLKFDWRWIYEFRN